MAAHHSSRANEDDRNTRRNKAERDSTDRAGKRGRWGDSWAGIGDAERRRELDKRIRERREDERDFGPPRYNFGYLRAGDVMTSNVCTIHFSDSVENAARAMTRCDCGALPVIDDAGRLIGMLTDRDIVVRIVERGIAPRLARVDECMTDQVFACHEEDSIESCMWQMAHHQVRRLPIVDDRDRVIGIVSQADLAQHAGAFPGRGERRALADVMCAVSEPTHVSYR